MSPTFSRLLVGAILVSSATIAIPAVGNSNLHLRLTASHPAKDSTLTSSPDKISLWYSQAPNLKLSRVTLAGPKGTVAIGKVQRDAANPKLLTTSITDPLADGKYVISWITASDDGHPIKGDIPFSVKTAK